MKTGASLVWTNGGAVLDPITTVNVYLAVIIYPCHPENNGSFRFNKPIQNAMLGILAMFGNKGPETFHYFGDSLHIFRLARITLGYGSAELLKTFILHYCPLIF